MYICINIHTYRKCSKILTIISIIDHYSRNQGYIGEKCGKKSFSFLGFFQVRGCRKKNSVNQDIKYTIF